MFDHLQIYNARERMLVGGADLLLGALTAPVRLLRRGRAALPDAPRVLVLRLERIGDLLMSLSALEALRARAPHASIHLVVGSWNAPIAQMIGVVDTVETLDVPWLARHASGDAAQTLVRRAWQWRERRFDLALNLEPDIRSNMLLALSGAPRRVGFRSAGGGRLLTIALEYEPRAHTAANLLRVIDAAVGDGPAEAGHYELARPAEAGHYDLGRPAEAGRHIDAGRLVIPADARERARELLRTAQGGSPIVGLHVSGGRPVKQWDLERFATAAERLARERQATIVFTGTTDDRAIVDRVIARLPPDIRSIDAAGALDLPVLGALLQQMDLLITGDTGPMHLAAAVGTPIVALFGPSDPARYGPLTDRARVLSADLWCRPCNRVRRPPDRCSHDVPDCLRSIQVDDVVAAAAEMLAAGRV